MTRAVVVAAVSLWWLPAVASAAEARSYPLPWGGSVEVPVPAAWTDAVGRAGGDARTFTLTLTPPGGKEAGIVMITVLRGPMKEPDLRALVERQGRALLPKVVERSLQLEELRGEQVRGFHYSLTDRAPKPGEHAHLTQGAASTGSVALSFTILAPGPQAPARQAGLDLLRGTRAGPPPR
jgi:hypothetical protein